jgi:glycosyltransferase involved in cell wall biosynthesis
MSNLANLRICLIAGTLGQGGAERQLFYIARALKESGAAVRLLSLTKGEYWEERIRQLGVPVTWVGKHGAKARRIGCIIKTLRDNPPDVVQSQHFYTNLYAVAAARVLGCREVGAMRNDCVSEVRASGAVLGRLSLRAPRTIAANSRAAIRYAIEEGVPSSRLHLLRNVVDTNRFMPATTQRQGGPVHLIAVGRLEQQKRMDRFLSVLARLRTLTTTPIRATIIGEGSLRTALEGQAAELGLLGGVVEFRGAVSDMAAVYRLADILVLTSDHEGTPNVALEAMASGLAVVATNVGGMPEVVCHQRTGFLAEAEDEASIASYVLELINDPGLRARIGRSARDYVWSDHSPERLPKALRDVYEVALS